MDLRAISDDRLRRELQKANEEYVHHISKIPEHAWQYEPYKSIRSKLFSLRQEFVRRKKSITSLFKKK